MKAGDIVIVQVKYKVLKVNEDGSFLGQKVYDVPKEAVVEIFESNEDGVL